VYPHIISYLLHLIDFERNGSLYDELTCEVMTYMLASSDDRRHGQRALRSVQELLPIQNRERHETVDAALEQVDHHSG
jgi:hypothetical protein